MIRRDYLWILCRCAREIFGMKRIGSRAPMSWLANLAVPPFSAAVHLEITVLPQVSAMVCVAARP